MIRNVSTILKSGGEFILESCVITFKLWKH